MKISGTVKLHNCSTCQYRSGNSFCDLPLETIQDLRSITSSGYFPDGVRLYDEGDLPRGIYILCSASAKLSITSRTGRSLMRIAEPGEILSLGAVIAGRSHESSAEILNTGQVNFIERDSFLAFLKTHSIASLRTAELLSYGYYTVYDQFRSLVLSDSVEEKLARLLLGWCARDGRETDQGIHLKLTLTHGEIAQMIGVSRETVTRLLGDLKSREVIQINGATLLIRNKAALESLACT